MFLLFFLFCGVSGPVFALVDVVNSIEARNSFHLRGFVFGVSTCIDTVIEHKASNLQELLSCVIVVNS